MKLGLIFPAAILIAGCSHYETVEKAKDIATVELPAGISTHLVWCKAEEECFTNASLQCSPDHNALTGGYFNGYPRPGKWHAVAENGMAFPAIIQEEHGWRMLIMCDEGT